VSELDDESMIGRYFAIVELAEAAVLERVLPAAFSQAALSHAAFDSQAARLCVLPVALAQDHAPAASQAA
jgi:hypothetical protein